MDERVQKILVKAGFGSRRSCEEYIKAGRVHLNGKVVCLGDKADITLDQVLVDGKIVNPEPLNKIYIACNKPRGILSDNNQKDNRPNVFDLVGVKQHLFVIGRLDLDSEGLIILTNDGLLSYQLTHPKYEHEKEYRVLVDKKPSYEQLNLWRRGILLDDGHRTAQAEVIVDGKYNYGAWLKIIMHEGRKRQIREVGGKLGLQVQRIIRVRIGTICLGKLKPGEWKYINEIEIHELKERTTRIQITGINTNQCN